VPFERGALRRRADGAFAIALLVIAALTIAALVRFGDALSHGTPTRRATPIQTSAAAQVATLPVQLRMYAMPQANADLMQPAVAPDGHVWFGEMGTNQLATLDPASGKVAAWTPPGGQNGIMAVAVAPDGTVWFTEQASNYIGRFDPRHARFATIPLPAVQGRPAAPQDIAIDAQGTVWFTEVSAGALGRLDPATSAIRSYPVPTEGSAPAYPFALALDAHGGVWYGELGSGVVGRLDPATGAVRRYHAPARDAQVFALAVDAGGRIWFTELQYGRLGMLDPSTGVVSEILLPATHGSALNVYGLAAAPDGMIWTASMGQNAIVRYDPAHQSFARLALPDAASVPYGVALDSSGTVWFTADRAPTNFVGRIER
jgi:virginiamycin B lyase